MAKVLIVEDNVLMRDFLMSSLKQDGFEVDTATSRFRIRRSKYDAVLSDIERPFSLDKFKIRLRLLGLTKAA